MFSAVKNFFLTFIIAIFVFIFVAYPIAQFIVINLSDSNVNAGVNEGPNGDEPQLGPLVPGPGNLYGDGGTSTNVLLVMTDYRPSTYTNYNPEQLKLLYGIEERETPTTVVPDDLGQPANLSVMSDKFLDHAEYYIADDGSLIFKDGFYEVPYKKINATSIVLLRIDKERGHTSFTLFPTEACVSIEGRYVKLGAIYADYGLQFLMDRIHALTGITIDNYIVSSYETLPHLQNTLLAGGVSCTVPDNLYLNDLQRDITVDLQMGRHLLDGNGAVQLLIFDAYNDGINTQEATTFRYVREFYTQYTNIVNYALATKNISAIIEHSNTDLTAEKLLDSVDMMFKYSASQIEINVPTTQKHIANKTLTVIEDEDAIRAFSNYRKIYY